MKVTVATRIHLPEPSAASFRIKAVETALMEQGCDLTVLTTECPKDCTQTSVERNVKRMKVKRWPVIRDKTGYVRGYLPYLSFDIPLFFRLLFSQAPDVVLVEPPPTTGAVVRVTSFIKRFPYVWYAADVWSDASSDLAVPKFVVNALRWTEKFAIRGASGVIAVSNEIASRVTDLGGKNIKVVPAGIDTDVYSPHNQFVDKKQLESYGVTGPYAIYAGTASEWQGATIFVQAFDRIAENTPNVQLVFVGQGTQWPQISVLAEQVNSKCGRKAVVLIPHSDAQTAAHLIAEAEVALVSIVPGGGYDYAYPTKVLAALSSGIPVLYVGEGPAVNDLVEAKLGYVSRYDKKEVAAALEHAFAHKEFKGTRLRKWIQGHRSAEITGKKAANFVMKVGNEGTTIHTHSSEKFSTGEGKRVGKHDYTVAVVTPWYPDKANPVLALFVEREVQALRNQNVNVKVIYLDRKLPSGATEYEVREGLQVLHIGMHPANPLSVSRAVGPLREALQGVDIVNSHAISVLPAVVLARGNKPWVHTEHWSSLSSPTSANMLLRVVRPGFASLLRLPDVVVAESERLVSAIRKFRGNKNTQLIPCIVESPKKLVPHPTNNGVLKLTSTGGVIDRKNPLLAVETLKVLQNMGVEASLRWTGDGDQREEATALAEQLGVDAKFLGPGSPIEVQQQIAQANIFFAPTKGENFFVAAAEALVNGRPLCASDQGGHVEYADPRFSEIVTEQTPQAYADALIRLRDKTKNVPAKTIYNSVAERFDPATVAKMYIKLYEELTQ